MRMSFKVSMMLLRSSLAYKAPQRNWQNCSARKPCAGRKARAASWAWRRLVSLWEQPVLCGISRSSATSREFMTSDAVSDRSVYLGDDGVLCPRCGQIRWADETGLAPRPRGCRADRQERLCRSRKRFAWYGIVILSATF
jgi:hypothetical protein